MLFLLASLTLATSPVPCCRQVAPLIAPAEVSAVASPSAVRMPGELVASAMHASALQSGAAAPVEPNESAHRIGHVIAPAIMTASFYGIARYYGASRKQSRIISAGLSLLAILGKELHDYRTEARAFSKLDVGFGVLGTAVGVGVGDAIRW